MFRALFRLTVGFMAEVAAQFVLFRPMGAIYFSGLYLSGRGAGWRRLVREFPDIQSPARLIVEQANGAVGKADFDHRPEMTSTDAGLRVAGMGVLGLMSRPYLVPWDCITEGGEGSGVMDPEDQ